MFGLSEKRQQEIEGVVNDVLLSIDKTYPEDGLEDIVESYSDITAWEYDFGKERGKISGAIAYSKDGKPRIYINKDMPPTRKTFTLAHEFGHYVLQHSGDRFRLDLFSDYSEDERNEETEANYFAAVLLMPKERFLQVYEKLMSEELVAEYFGVSILAVRLRLLWIQRQTTLTNS